ncbi:MULTISPECIES: RluA family pseudouridine synthase [Pelosinus]|uniref:Pseudouridine synthase n=1 Tax=Pelosinus fermentans B4 TaxID=1149862 RepID=I9LCF4_9FIRM|nr:MULTISPECIES: RluA family pseudouridine synthase [Pelosinus]EIW18114.1 pseudouridine synthase, RluA family [Pelosinus fermentans B4]EIW24152.1 pseudouridine synthase, RluA family [Pelosinus fermentans A11]OAM94153.1 pseudouridine synthase, RluA family [Pelosinus fermentans DSM 17108]SDR01537.1 23S rRNA pseudouridine1911/1915/1917 synthase [Pelosinus fermentans]
MGNEMYYHISESQAGERLDIFLTKQMPGISRSAVQRLISSGDVTVNKKIAKANYKVQELDDIQVSIPEIKTLELTAEEIPLAILYEDNDIIIINKSRGMVVHPAPGNYNGTLVNALLEHCEDLSGINGVARPGIVHRLDKDTSGVMAVAKSDRAHVSLAKQIKERTASRRYLAIVYGNIKEDHGVIKAPIGRHPSERKKMAVTFTNSKEATTKFRVMERFGDYTLVECKLLTGRTHQIRVHMTYIGHSVVGDPKYGPGRMPFSIIGQALHSAELRISHPVTEESMTFTAPLPEDMEMILKELRQKTYN